MPIDRTHAFLIKQVACGRQVDMRSSELDPLPLASRTLKAEWIRDLLVSAPLARETHEEVAAIFPEYCAFIAAASFAPLVIGPIGIRVANATIAGVIDISSCATVREHGLPALALERCRLEGEVLDGEGYLTSLAMDGCRIAALCLKGSRLSHVRAIGAEIGGELDLSQVAPLDDTGATKRRDWFGVERGVLERRVQRHAEHIDAWSGSPADGCAASEGIAGSASEAWSREWPVRLDAHCWFDFSRARIGGRVLADGALMRIPLRDLPMDTQLVRRTCLNLSASRIDGSINVQRGSVLEGGMDIDAADISGDLNLRGARVTKGERMSSIAAGFVSIRGSAWFGEPMDGVPFESFGRIWLHNARIAGEFNLTGALLDGDGDDALVAESLRVGGSLNMGREFLAHGCLWLYDAEIGGNFDLRSATIVRRAPFFRRREGPPFPPAICAYGLRVTGHIGMTNNRFAGMLDLRDASCATLVDGRESYRGACPIEIDGLRYGRLENPAMVSTKNDESADRLSDADFLEPELVARERWLCMSAKYRPQPYVQLAQALALHGYEIQSRNVLIWKARRELKSFGADIALTYAAASRASPAAFLKARLLRLTRLFIYSCRRIFGLCFGFGLSPTRALWTFAASWVLGWALFSYIEVRDMMVVSQQPVASYINQTRTKMMAPEGPEKGGNIKCDDVRTSLYALDVLIPVVDLREEGKCEIDNVGEVGLGLKIEMWLYRFLKAAYAIWGWIFTSLALLTFSGVLQHRRSPD